MVKETQRFLARTKEDVQGRLLPEAHWQPLKDHLVNAAEVAYNFAMQFNAGELARDIALMHDLGKYSQRFQERLRGRVGQIDHSTPGGKEVLEKNNTGLGYIAAYCIMGHHSGLPDGGSRVDSSDDGTLHGRMKRKTEAITEYQQELAVPMLQEPRMKITNGYSASFLTRMLYSTLVDADSLDAERFAGEATRKVAHEDISALYAKLMEQLEGFLNPAAPPSELNRLRTSLLERCLESAEGKPGLYTLTAPTGSGKTIASMAFALRHAKVHGKRRVIFVVPYNTIIEQNARVYEELLGEHNILQHHANVIYDDEEKEDEEKLLATENWDYPIIVTSSVQFFESIYSNRRSCCRKLPNIANSVTIFDEAQMIPVHHLVPCVSAVDELVLN